jgi:2-dehydro-3-deoxyglucarate aldolase
VNRLERIRATRRALTQGSGTVGTWMQLADANLAELLAGLGYDWVAIDAEHGHVDTGDLPDLIRAIELGGSLPLVRVSHPASMPVRHALDAGAGGVIIPMITDADQLTQLIAACRWPPYGSRGVGFCRANGFGTRFEEYRTESAEVLVVAQVEHARAVERIESIATVDGLDAVMIGPYDLSASLGHTGELDHPDVVSSMRRVLEVCSANGVAAGIHVTDPDPTALRGRIEEGYRFVAYGVDTVFVHRFGRRPS